MNRPIRRVGVRGDRPHPVAGRAAHLPAGGRRRQPRQRPEERTHALKEYNRARGKILTADGQVVAESIPTTGDFKYLRFYPQVISSRTSPATSRSSTWWAARASRSRTTTCSPARTPLAARQPRQRAQREGADQRRRALALQDGAADGRAGAGGPAGLDRRARRADRRGGGDVLEPQLRSERPVGTRHARTCRPRSTTSTAATTGRAAAAYRDRYPPGSTFKTITTKSALETNTATPDTEFPFSDGFQIPGIQNPLRNFGNGSCGGHADRQPGRVVQRDVRAARLRDGRRVRTRDGPVRHQPGAADRPLTAAAESVGPTWVPTSRASRWRASARVTSPRRPWRWRSSPRASPTAVSSRNPTSCRRSAQQRRHDGAHDRVEGLDDVHAADHRGRAHQHDGAGRGPGSGTSARSTGSPSPARPAPRRPQKASRRTRGSSPSRPPKRRATRSR